MNVVIRQPGTVWRGILTDENPRCEQTERGKAAVLVMFGPMNRRGHSRGRVVTYADTLDDDPGLSTWRVVPPISDAQARWLIHQTLFGWKIGWTRHDFKVSNIGI